MVAWGAAGKLILPGSRRMTAPRPRTVFLLHGMGRSRLSMQVLAFRFRRAGRRAVCVPYDHAALSLDAITRDLLALVAREAGGVGYDLVGHSLGNIIIRNGFKAGYPPGLGRVVMLAPPNSPPALARVLRDFPPYRWLGGDSGQRLADPAFYASLPAPEVPFAVVAGERGLAAWGEPNDAVLPVACTRLAGMREFHVVRRSHTFIMNAPETFELAEGFLRGGGEERRG